jgi:hypothetical protein
MKNTLQLIPVCIAALALSAPTALQAAEKKSPDPSTKTAPPAAKDKTERAIPFHGMISTVDQTAKTFTIAGKEKARVFKVTDKTVLTKAGAPATMKDVLANEEVRGSYVKAADGSLEARIVKLGPMTDAEKAASSKSSKKKAKPDASPGAAPSASPRS